MRNKKIFSLVMALAISTSLFIGCNKDEVENTSTDAGQSIEQILETYTEEGMTLLKNNFTTTDEMIFALKNIGLNISGMKFKTYEGKEISLKDFKGKNIILEISQTKCDTCKTSAPVINNVLKDNDVELVPVFLNSNKEEITAFYEELKMEMPKNIIIDKDKVTKEKFGLTVTPTYIFVDETGTISLIKEKFVDETQFKDDLKLAFSKKPIYEYKDEIEEK